MFRKLLEYSCLAGVCAASFSACSSSPSTAVPASLAVSGVSLSARASTSERSDYHLPADPELSDYLRMAALNNSGLEAAFERWKAALERLPQVRALPDPKFTYGYFIERVETRVGAQRQRVAIAQTFPWFGKLRLKEDRASERADVAKQAYEQAKLKLFSEVKDAYYELVYLREAIALTEESIELVKHLESVAQAKFRAGSDATGVVRAHVELGKLEDRLNTLRDLREPLNVRINLSLNRDYSAEVPWPKHTQGSVLSFSDRELYQTLISTNPELEGLSALIRESERSVELSKKAFYPDLTLSVDYVETKDSFLTGIDDNGKDPVMVMGSFSLPLWWGKYRAGVREAEATRNAARKNREHRENLLISELKMMLYRYRDAERKVGLFGDTLTPLAKNALDVTEQAYQSGRSDFLELIDAQRLLLDIQLSFQRSIADREQRLAQIEMLIGRSIESALPSADNPLTTKP